MEPSKVAELIKSTFSGFHSVRTAGMRRSIKLQPRDGCRKYAPDSFYCFIQLADKEVEVPEELMDKVVEAVTNVLNGE